MAGDSTRWASPPARVGLPANEVHVWRAALDVVPSVLEACAALLTTDERTRAARLHAAQHRRHFVAAHGFLRSVLGRYLSIPPAAVRFTSGPHGKPVLAASAADRTLHFNLSHSHGCALVAVARGREVGVDLERVRAAVRAMPIAMRFFSAGEQQALRGLRPALMRKTFFRLWTCKEAYVKATGEGVARELHAIEIRLRAGAPDVRRSTNPAESARWSLRELPVGRAYAAALAVEGKGWRLRRWRWRTP